jgi:hypothetical protein
MEIHSGAHVNRCCLIPTIYVTSFSRKAKIKYVGIQFLKFYIELQFEKKEKVDELIIHNTNFTPRGVSKWKK